MISMNYFLPAWKEGKNMTRNEKLNSLFCEDYRIIDFLPKTVPETADKFYEEVEEYFLRDRQLQEFCNKTIAIVLKILCYYPFDIYVEEYVPFVNKREGWLKDKSCEMIIRLLKKVILKKKGQIDILLGTEDSIISISGGVLSVAVYHESASLRELLDKIVETEGLYCWKYRV